MRLLWITLLSSVLVSSFFLIQVSFEVRVHYQQLQSLRVDHQQLATRHGQLQLEVGALQALPLVEQMAALDLNMYVPAKEELIIWLK